MPDSQALEAHPTRSGASDVPEAPETLVAPVRHPGRPRGRQNNATLDARAFYKPKAKKLANKKIKAANVILDRYLDGKKVTDAELTFAERVSTQCAHYAFGKPKETTEISGPEGGPIRTEDAPPLDMVELGRRAAFLLDLAGRDAGEAGQEGHSETRGAPPFSTPRAPVPHSGHTPPENSEEKLEKNSARNPDEAWSPDSRLGATATGGGLPPSASAPASTGLSHEVAGAYSDVYGWIEGGHAPITAEGGEANHAAPEPPGEPVPGETAEVAGHEIRCHANSREGLPDIFEIWDEQGRQVRYPVNGFERALKKIRELAGEGADMTVTISKPRPAFSQSRPDERALRTPHVPEVHGSYANRKRN